MSDELLAKVREIIEEGNARRLYIKWENGETIFETPLTAGVAVTAASAVFAPILGAVGAALATSLTIGVERPKGDQGDDENSSESEASKQSGKPEVCPVDKWMRPCEVAASGGANTGKAIALAEY